VNQTHGRGYLGEQTIGFLLGERGYVIVEGPGGSAGHGITAPGFDGVAYHADARHLIIYDNKAYRRSGNVATATAIDPSRNLEKNLTGLIGRLVALADMPNRMLILHLLRKARDAVASSAPWPPEVALCVFNAAGNSTGVTQGLEGRGILFLSIEDFGKPTHRGRLPSPFNK
jgi:hypothetical protein